MVFFFNLSPTSSHLYLLQVENCDSSSRLVVDKFRLERVDVWITLLRSNQGHAGFYSISTGANVYVCHSARTKVGFNDQGINFRLYLLTIHRRFDV